MTRTLALGLILVLLAPASVGATTSIPGDAGAAPAGDGVRASVLLDDRGDLARAGGGAAGRVQAQTFDQTVFRVAVSANGSARWTFVYKRSLNVSERDEFERFAANFTGEETDLYRDFERRARDLVATAESETGRSMDATDFRRDAYVTPLGNQGVVEMSFEWSNFANVSGDRVAVGDVFEGGLYVGPNQRFVVTWGDDLSRVSYSPQPTGTAATSVTWSGGADGKQFLDERPSVVLTTASTGGDAGTGPTITSPGPTGTASPPGTDGPTGTDDTATTTPLGASTGGGDGMFSVLVGVGLALLVAAVAVAGYRSGVVGTARDDEADSGVGDARDEPEVDASGASDASDATPEEPAPDEGTVTTGADADLPADPDVDAGAPAVPDEELLTDEDRVMRLLEGNGGRMKQSGVVEATGWSKSKVSMLLSEMEEEGEISKLRVGRENIVSIAGEEPDVARSPFEGEADDNE